MGVLEFSEVGGGETTGKSFRFVRACDAKLCVSARGDDVSIAGVSNCE